MFKQPPVCYKVIPFNDNVEKWSKVTAYIDCEP